MNRRALLIASLLAVIGMTLHLLYLRKFEREKSGGEQVELLVLLRPIERGSVLTDEHLATRSIPIAYVEDRAVKAAERSKVIGLQTAVSLEPQQTLFWTDLAIVTEDRDLSRLVQPGKRGVTVRAASWDDNRGNALIRPGDYVDVITTMSEETGIAKDKTSIILLQRVLVLAVGASTTLPATMNANPASSLSAGDRVLTLSLNLAEAQLLALALEKGRISVAVRNPDDPSVLQDVPDMKAAALFNTRERVQIQKTSRSPSSASHPIKIE